MKPVTKRQSRQVRHILELAAVYGAHLNITHWAVSKHISPNDPPKSDHIHRLLPHGDLVTRNAEAIIARFHDIWPPDLEWPEHIPRPEPDDTAV